MKSAGIKAPILPRVHEYIDANTLFETKLADASIVHMDQESLRQVVTNCERRAIGSGGGFGFRSKVEGVDIALLDSVILAVWACNNAKEEQKQKISY